MGLFLNYYGVCGEVVIQRLEWSFIKLHCGFLKGLMLTTVTLAFFLVLCGLLTSVILMCGTLNVSSRRLKKSFQDFKFLNL